VSKRQITDHVVNPVNDRIAITVQDTPGAGGACHRYAVRWTDRSGDPGGLDVRFQDGPIAEAGVNGITQEVLLAIVADRLRGFQAGGFACRENALALTKVEEALMWLHRRTRDRMQRGVEGTHGA